MESKKTSENIYQKISSIMSEIGAIGKTNTNKMQGFKFRGIDDVYNALHPLLNRYQVFTVPEVIESVVTEKPSRNGGTLFYTRIKMKYTFYTVDGSSFESVVIGEAMDSGDKSANKAMSIAHKYCLLQVFSIPLKESHDPDKETHYMEAQKKTPPRPATAKSTPSPTVSKPATSAKTVSDIETMQNIIKVQYVELNLNLKELENVVEFAVGKIPIKELNLEQLKIVSEALTDMHQKEMTNV